MSKAPVLTTKGKVIIIVVSVLVALIGLFFLGSWAYGETHDMTFNDVLMAIFDSEKYDLKSEVVSLSKTKLDYENSIKDMTTNVETQSETIEILQAQIARNNELIEELNMDSVTNATQINALESENASLLRVIENLTDSNNLTVTTINMMSTQLTEINELLTYYINLNEQTYNEFITLRTRNAELENKLKSYNGIIKDLSDKGYKIVTFMVNNEVYDIEILQRGEFIGSNNVPNIDNTVEFVFDCWTLNGERLIGSYFDETCINEDVTFTAQLIDITNAKTINFSDLLCQGILSSEVCFQVWYKPVECGKTYKVDFNVISDDYSYDCFGMCLTSGIDSMAQLENGLSFSSSEFSGLKSGDKLTKYLTVPNGYTHLVFAYNSGDLNNFCG